MAADHSAAAQRGSRSNRRGSNEKSPGEALTAEAQVNLGYDFGRPKWDTPSQVWHGSRDGQGSVRLSELALMLFSS